jgi:hypothetical protein
LSVTPVPSGSAEHESVEKLVLDLEEWLDQNMKQADNPNKNLNGLSSPTSLKPLRGRVSGSNRKDLIDTRSYTRARARGSVPDSLPDATRHVGRAVHWLSDQLHLVAHFLIHDDGWRARNG